MTKARRTDGRPGDTSAFAADRRLSRLALCTIGVLQVLTLPGGWIVTDQGEAVLTARRWLEAGRFTLADSREDLRRDAPWALSLPGDPPKSRLLPGTPLLLVPLLAIDRALGFDTSRDGGLTTLQGPFSFLVGLAFLARALRSRGVSDAASATALLAIGTCWPLWLVAHRGGPEPVLAALAFAREAIPKTRAGRWGRAACLGLMPWFNPSGSVLAAALLAGSWVEARAGDRSGFRGAWPEAAGLAMGQASVMLIWNFLYHGHWISGGYHLVGVESSFGVVPWAEGVRRHVMDLALEAPVVLALAAVAPVVTGLSRISDRSQHRSPRGELVALATPLLCLGFHIAFFATYGYQEPSRRLAPALGSFGVAAGLGARICSGPQQALTAATALAVGLFHFMSIEGRYYQADDGLFYPSVFWVKRVIDHGLGLDLIPPLLLLALFAGSFARFISALLRPIAPTATEDDAASAER